MTNSNEAANMYRKGDLVSPTRADAGSGIVDRLTTVIRRLWDAINVNVGEMDADDGECYPTGGCCCA